jgi:hypothetical protein
MPSGQIKYILAEPIELPNQLYDEMRAAGLPIPPPVEFVGTPQPAAFADPEPPVDAQTAQNPKPQ